MKWLEELIDIPERSMLNVSIPKEKLIANIRTKFVQMAAARELDYIEDIIYHAIFRDVVEGQTIDELHIIEVKLHEPKYVKIIAEAFQQAIPYSLVIVFSSGEKYLLFKSYTDSETVKQHQFSEWVYEEELLIDFSLGSKKQYDNTIVTDNWETWYDLTEYLDNLFFSASSSQFLSLRHLIDLLKIREIETGNNYLWPIISQLVYTEKIEYFDDTPFVTWGTAQSLYIAANPRKSMYSGIKDERFGIDRQFEPLSCADFTSLDETMEILLEIEHHVSYSEWSSPNYKDDDLYCDDPERYGDDENYDYAEPYGYYN